MQELAGTDCNECEHATPCVITFKEVLRVHQGRLTEERKLLLQTICDYRGHFLPEDIAAEARHRGHPVSLTTVYRNLPLLIEAGIVRRATVGEGSDRGGVRYESVWNRAHHDHLTCSRCGRQVEFSYPAIEVLQGAVAQDHGFTLERHHLELIGVCPECQAQEPVEGRPQ
jgi:Fur family ferric uptake transcriptional regulator